MNRVNHVAALQAAGICWSRISPGFYPGLSYPGLSGRRF